MQTAQFATKKVTGVQKNDNVIIIVILLITILFAMACALTWTRALSEDAYIICHPDSEVVVRENPRKTAHASGELKVGDKIHLDGKKRNGYYHCVDMANETGDGWVSSQYIVFDEPYYINRQATVISKGRLAARSSIKGKVKRWLKPQSLLTVYYITEEWCVTDKGYVKTKYLGFY